MKPGLQQADRQCWGLSLFTYRKTESPRAKLDAQIHRAKSGTQATDSDLEAPQLLSTVFWGLQVGREEEGRGVGTCLP